MIAQFRQFSEGAVSLAVSDDLLKEALNRLLGNAIVESIVEKLRGTNNLPGLAQIIANLEFFYTASEQLSSQVLASR